MDYYLVKLNVTVGEKTNDHIKLIFDENSNGENIFRASKKYTSEVKINYVRGKLHVIFYIFKLKENWIVEISKFLERIDNL